MFKEIEKTLDDVSLTIFITKKGSVISASVLPKSKNNDVSMNLAPIVLSGTADELDSEFGDVVSKSLLGSSEMIKNVEAFEVSVKKEDDEKESDKAKKAEKKSAKAEVKPVTPIKDVTVDLFANAPSLPAPATIKEIVKESPNIMIVKPTPDVVEENDEEEECCEPEEEFPVVDNTPPLQDEQEEW